MVISTRLFFTIREVGEQCMFSQPNKNLQYHVYEIHLREVLDNLVAETKNMLADFSGKEPRQISVYDN